MAIDMVRDYLCLVAVKSFVYVAKEADGQVRWTRSLAPLRKGLVDWPAAIEALEAVGYDGPVSFHSEYPNVSLDELRALTGRFRLVDLSPGFEALVCGHVVPRLSGR